MLKKSLKPSATVSGDVLILSLPNAVNPTVWRWDLSDIKASALEVRAQDSDNYILVLKTPKGDVQDVAPFSSNGEALAALLAVSEAMEKNKNYGNKNTSMSPPPVMQKNMGGESGKVLMGLGAIAIIFMLFLWINSLTPTRLDNNVTAASGAQSGAQSGEVENGVAVSAEDFISGF